MRVVVTGGAGFIGGHLASAFVQSGDETICFDNLTEGREENCQGATLVVGDVTDEGSLLRVFGDVEVVVHLAAMRSVARSVEDPVGTDRVNAGGTLRVLEAARQRGVRRVIVTSSSSVYGGVAPVPTSEPARLSPRSPYAASKVAGEHYAAVYRHVFGLETVVLRPFNIFGPRQNADSPYSGVISLFIAAALEGRSPVIFGDGTQSRDFTYVDDAVAAFRLAATASYDRLHSPAYNVGAGAETTLLALWEHIRMVTGSELTPEFGPARPGDVNRSRADISRATEELGYLPRVNLAEGLRRTVEWARVDR